MAEYAVRLSNSVDTRERVRKADALTLTPGPGANGARNGLRNDGGGAVTAVAGTMTVQVSPLLGWVDGGASDAQGGYPFVLDATKTLTIANGDAVLSRTDTVVVEVRDNTHDASGFTDATVRVVAGTPGAGAPALPSSCIPLRDVTVPAGLSAGTGGLASGNIGTDRRVYTAAAGGIVPVASATVRDAMGAKAGQAVYRTDTKTVQVFNGTTWDTQAITADTGWVNLTLSGTWVSQGVAGEPAPSYRVLNGVCYLRGRIKDGSTAAGSLMFTLDAAARPSADIVDVPAVRGTSASDLWKVTIKSNGRVEPVALSAATFVSLNGLSFPVG